MRTGQLMTLLEPSLSREGLSRADREELVFHLSDILADIYPMIGLLTRGVRPSPAVVRQFIFELIWHWPYHQKKAAKLEQKMKKSVVGRGTFKRPPEKAPRKKGRG